MFNNTPDPRVLWSARESMYDLMVLRASIGEGAFNSEKLNDPADPSLCEWPPALFDRADLWFHEWPEPLPLKVCALDPSKGKDARKGDPSALIAYGRDKQGREYVEADIKRRPVDAICRDAARMVKWHHPECFVLEGNAWQDLLAAPLQAAFAEAEVECRIVLVDNTVNKVVRVRRLTTPLVQRRLRFKARSPGTYLLVQQLRDFPHGDFDDGPDATEMARRVGIELHNGGRRR